MDNDAKHYEERIQRLERDIFTSAERAQSWKWQGIGGFAIVIMGAVVLVAAHFGWQGLMTPTLVLGITAAVGCGAVSTYHLVHSFIGHPPPSQTSASTPSDSPDHGSSL